MNLNPEDKSELTRELMLGFHTQFAENQRSRKQSFLRLLALLVVPIGGYAYVYHYYQHPTETFSVVLPELYLVQIVSALLIFAGTWTIVTIANNFRRDQFVNAKIRKECDLLGDDKIFPKSYDPLESLKEQGLFKWMPDFLFVFFVLFSVFQVLLLYLFYRLTSPTLVCFTSSTDPLLTLSLALSWVLLLLSIIVLPLLYRRKLIRVMKVDKKQYGLWSTYKRIVFNKN
jgi:hypothetical protein